MSFKELFSRTKYTHYRRDIHVLRRTKQVNHHYYKSHTLSHLHVKTHKGFCTGECFPNTALALSHIVLEPII